MITQPTDAMHIAPSVLRSICKSIVATAAVFCLLVMATAAEAQSRARLSSDLRQHLSEGRATAVDVIVSGTPEAIALLASRHGLAVKKTLRTGAVLTASPAALSARAAAST